MQKFKSEYLNIAQERGFLFQCTNFEGLDNLLAKNKPVVAYWGTDPTGKALHVGHLFSLMNMRLFQKCGHKPIILVGGGTGLIGDPSFKDKSRPMLSKEQINENKAGIEKCIRKFIEFGNDGNKAAMVDNADWLAKLNYLEFLRDIGPHFSVNRMLSFDSVQLRLQKEEHMSFLEFNYMILQAYDFYYLNKNYNCKLQLCGGDQWGNTVAGVELMRRLNFAKGEESEEAYGLSTALLTDSNGKKMGKSEGNALWVDGDLFPAFDYFQFFRNVADADVEKFLKVYTELPIDEIKKLSSLKDKEINEAKKILAFEATKICHGEKIAEECLEKANKIFEEKSEEALPIIEIKNESEKALFALLRETGLVESGGEARRLIVSGAIKINDEKITDESYKISNLKEFKLSIGKKKHVKIVVKHN